MRILRLVALVGVVLLTGCMSDDQKTRLQQQASTPLTCLPGNDCDAKWRRARSWITDNSHFPILKATDKTIITDSSPDTLYPVVSARMIANEQDPEENSIVLDAECQNMLGCMPTELQMTADFKSYVDDVPAAPEVDNDIDLGVTFAPQQGKSTTLIITAVAPGSPAAGAGWQAGDHLVKFNGHPVTSGAQVAGWVADTAPGSVFPVQISRSGSTIVTFMRL